MNYKTDYIVVEGLRNAFEKEMNRLSNDGYMLMSDMSATMTDKGILYSQLMAKTDTMIRE